MAKAASQFVQFGLPAGPAVGNPDRRAHLEFVRDLREGTRPRPQNAGFGAVALSIPELDYYILLARFPELGCKDPETRTRAWGKFIRSPLSEPYRVRRNDGKRIARV
jgi:hypothetical protein